MMDERSRAVLDAADKWLAAAEVVVAIDEDDDRPRSLSEQGELDGAEVQLAVAVKEWRDAGWPS
jgi:hypothetical protein